MAALAVRVLPDITRETEPGLQAPWHYPQAASSRAAAVRAPPSSVTER